MTGEIIIADTIQVTPIQTGIYNVTASVMGASDSRDSAKNVTVRWNSTEGSTVCKNRLISAYQALITPPESSILSQLVTDIGTVIPE
jgi:hypothetical protein